MRKTRSPKKAQSNKVTSEPVGCRGGDAKMETGVGREESQLDDQIDSNQSGDTTNTSQLSSSRTELTFADPAISEEFQELQKLLGLADEVQCLKRIFEIIGYILTSPWPWNLWKNRLQLTSKEPSTLHHHANSEVRGHICMPVNASIEKWFKDAVDDSKLEPEDFLIYLLLVYSQINTSILFPTGETSAETTQNLVRLTNQEKSCRRQKYPELTLSTLVTEISTVAELFASNLSQESGCEKRRSGQTVTEVRRRRSGTRENKEGDVGVKRCKKPESVRKQRGRGQKGVSKPSARRKSRTRETQVEDVVKVQGRPQTTVESELNVVGGDVVPEAEEENAVQRKILRSSVKVTKRTKALLGAETGASGDEVLHIVTEHRDPMGLRTKKDYILHKDETAKTVARRRVYECRLCQKRCHGWASWYNHKKQHSANLPDIVCPTCGWITKTKSGMWAHRKRHGNIREKCPHCEYTSYVKSAVNVHIMQVHPELSKKKPRVHICDTCKRQFKTSSNLRVHVKLHKRLVRDQVCSDCDKSFYSRKLLQDHVRSVHAHKRYSCEKCDKKFAKKRSLEIHINRVHLRIKAIRCNYEDCGQSFYEKKDLKQHIIVYHTKEKNYPCEWETCNKSFRTLYQRKIHMRIHTDERPLKCPHCDYSARQRTSLTCHLKKHVSENVSGNIASSVPGRRKRTTLLKGETRTVTFVASIPAQSGAVVNQMYDPIRLSTPQPHVQPLVQLDWVNYPGNMQKAALEPVPGHTVSSSTSHDAQALFTTVPILSAEQLSATFPGAERSEHSGSFRATIVNMDVESSGKPTFTKRVIDIPESDEYKTVPVVDMAGQVPNSLPYVVMPGSTAQQSRSSMMTVPVFTAQDLMSMTSLPAQQPVGVTMATANLAQQPRHSMTEAEVAMVTSQEQLKYPSMPIFMDGESLTFLKPEHSGATDQQQAPVVAISSAGGAAGLTNVPVAVGDEHLETGIPANSMLLPVKKATSVPNPRPLATEDMVSIVTCPEPQKYLSMPTFSGADGFSFLKP